MVRIFFTSILSALGISLLITPALAHHPRTFNYIDKPIPPMPPWAQESGYCCMSYDILPDGTVRNAKADYCTQPYFRLPAEMTLKQWRYETKRKDGSPVQENNVTAMMSWYLSDEQGKIIPGQNNFMTRLPNGEYYKEKVCSPLIS